MAYPVSTSIHLFFDGALPLNEQIERHTRAGFRYLDFNFLDWQNAKDSPLLADGWESWIDSAGETAARRGACFNQAHAPVPCLRFDKDYEGLVAVRSALAISLASARWFTIRSIGRGRLASRAPGTKQMLPSSAL